jgi:putative exosortase-associated protein (TIGR04073 family)
VALCVCGCSSTNWVARDDEPPAYRAPRKLARGFVNLVFGPFELLNQPFRLGEKEKGTAKCVAGALTGIPVGIGYGVWRMTAGLFDILSAPACVPQRAIIEPEFIQWAKSLRGDVHQMDLEPPERHRLE